MRNIFLYFVTLQVLFGAVGVLHGGESGNRSARQAADTNFNPNVARPAYVSRHPKVLFDEAHNNADTSGGRYKPFSGLITKDGYRVTPNIKGFDQSSLRGYDVLVVVNASGPQTQRDAPAFTPAECDAVRDWVSAGGALLLITDNAPYSSAVSELSERFGIELTKGFTIDTVHYNKEARDQTELVFGRSDGLVLEHPITRGRNQGEKINRIITFTGTSLKGPKGSVPFLTLSNTAKDVFPPDHRPAPGEQEADHKVMSAAGRAQGMALQFGKGRVVVLGEAAMLTAQVGSRGFHFGMTLPNFDNRQLALNIMHWLTGLLR